MKSFSVNIITPEETIFDGTAVSLFLPSVSGQMEVLAEHAPAFIMLGSGLISVRIDDTNTYSFKVESGYAQITHSSVKILPEHITKV